MRKPERGDTRWLLYGVPGVGKSTTAAVDSRRLGVAHLELDALRDRAHDVPYTTDAWRRFGPLSAHTAVRGLIAVRAQLAVAVQARLRAEATGYIAEAAFLDPAAASALGADITLLVCRDEARHHARFWVHRQHNRAGEQQFRAARHIQDYLVAEAQAADITLSDVGDSS